MLTSAVPSYNRNVLSPTILIIGAGQIGQALAELLRLRPTSEVILWDKDPRRCSGSADLPDLIGKAGAIFYCAPSWAFQDTLKRYGGLVSPHAAVYSLAKGIDPASYRFIDELLAESLPHVAWSIVGGPMLAEELHERIPGGIGVIASADADAYWLASFLFRPSGLRLTHTSDTRGVAVAGVLKNIYALLLGTAAGLEFGSNVRGYLLGEMLQELDRFGRALGGKTDTFFGPAGIGDLIATGSSPYSAHFSVGREVAHNRVPPFEPEGINALRTLERLVPDLDAYPYADAARLIFLKHANPHRIFHYLLG